MRLGGGAKGRTTKLSLSVYACKDKFIEYVDYFAESNCSSGSSSGRRMSLGTMPKQLT